MNDIIAGMLKQYQAVTLDEKKNALKEIIQEIVLCGLARARFFDKAAFYGGTALRIFYGLDRFSEDLDFSLKTPKRDFQLSAYFPILEKEITSFGLRMKIEEKEKGHDSPIKSAFVKGGTQEHLMMFYADSAWTREISKDEMLKIKFEVDINPPGGATFQHQFCLHPMPFEATLYDAPSLFAGKMHAVLCRGWKNRIKGRDLYDFIFYLQKGIGVNLEHLRQRLIQSQKWEKDKELTITDLKCLLCERFDCIDYDNAKGDVINFIKDKSSLDIWKASFFKAITDKLKGL